MESDDFIDDLADEDLMLALEAASVPTNPAPAAKTAPVAAAASSFGSARPLSFAEPTPPPVSRINAGRGTGSGQPITVSSSYSRSGFQPPQRPQQKQSAANAAAELADLPSDAFDSSFSSLAPGSGQSQRSFIASVRQPMRVGTQGSSFRQTTLFGGTIEEEQPAHPSSSNRIYRGELPPEKPTHHKLDHEALKTWVYPINLGPVRDYQFNIVKSGLFNNTLVALPTGLGKTFIAATIMLNFYRWTEEAKLLFLAPTKPLVSQQVEACLNIAGIPRSDSTLLTGETSPALREAEWATKRVFFMTPQTLQNDLSHGYADPKSIALLVIDEAHRATGDYAYVKVIGFMRRFTKSFRVLALTATPGSTVEGVQDVIDNLGVSHVEIRTEESLDIREYVHSRGLERYALEPSVEMRYVQEHLSKALKPLCEKLDQQRIWYGRDPMSLTTFGLQKARQEWMNGAARNVNQGIKFMIGAIISVLQSVAHSIKLLNYHGIKPFYDNIAEFRRATEKDEKASKYRSQLVRNPDFQEMMMTIEGWLKQDSFESHPKIGFLRERLFEHFMDKPPGSSTRAIVFSEFRDSAEEIVRTLNRSGTNIKASIFVGQADSKRSAGMKQKQQIAAIEDFKLGVFNVLVATSIGEEGLDIGQVDLIICYDASSSPIRMLQRMGRTGRKRSGHVILLLMKGKEEEKFAEAQENYSQMQKLICDGSRFNFRYDLSERILPRDVKPVEDRRHVEIPFENTQDPSLPEPKKTNARLKKSKKKFHLPEGVENGFVTAASVADGGQGKLWFGAAAKKPQPPPPPSETEFLAEIPDLETAVQAVKTMPGMNRSLTSSVLGQREDPAEIDTAHPDFLQKPRPVFYLKHGAYTLRNVGLVGRLVEGAYTRPRDRGDAYKRIRVPRLVTSSDAEGEEEEKEEEEAEVKEEEEEKMVVIARPGTRRVTADRTDEAKRRRVSAEGACLPPLAKTKSAASFKTPKRTQRERLAAPAYGGASDDNDDDDDGDDDGGSKSRRRGFKQTVKGMTRQRSSQFQAYSSYTFTGGRGESSVKREERSSSLEAFPEPKVSARPTPAALLRRKQVRNSPTPLLKKTSTAAITPLLKKAPAAVAQAKETSTTKSTTASTTTTTTAAVATASAASKQQSSRPRPRPRPQRVSSGYLDDSDDAKEESDDAMGEEGGIVDIPEPEEKQEERRPISPLDEFMDAFDDEITLSLPDMMAAPRNIETVAEEDVPEDIQDAAEEEEEDDLVPDMVQVQEQRRPPSSDGGVEVIQFSQPARRSRASLRKRASRSTAGRGRGRGGGAGAGAASAMELDDEDGEGTKASRRGARGRGRGRGRARGGGRGGAGRSYGRLEERGDDCTRTSDNYETDGSDSGRDLLDFIVEDDEEEEGGGGGMTSSLGFVDEEDDDDNDEDDEPSAPRNRRSTKNAKKNAKEKPSRPRKSEAVPESSPMPSSPPIRRAKAADDTGSSSFYVPMQLDSDGAEEPAFAKPPPARRTTRADVFVQPKKRVVAPPPQDDIEDIDDSEDDNVFAARGPQRARRRVFGSDSP